MNNALEHQMQFQNEQKAIEVEINVQENKDVRHTVWERERVTERWRREEIVHGKFRKGKHTFQINIIENEGE